MTLTEKQFEEYLMLYGTDIDQWPEVLQAEALRATYTLAIDALIIRQQYFDETLLNNDVIEPASKDLVDRILRAARSMDRKGDFNIIDWLGTLFADFKLPQPAYVAVIVMLLGVGLGVSTSDPSVNAGFSARTVFTDDGATL